MAYDPGKEEIGEEARKLAAAAFAIGEKVNFGLTEDEDPGKLDLDDLLAVLTDEPIALYDLIVGVSKMVANRDYATAEGMGHGIASQLLK